MGRQRPHPRDVLKRSRGIAWRLVEGEAVLVNVGRDEVMHLNPVASFIWSRMDGEVELEELARGVAAEFEVDYDTALSDALDFAQQLMDQGVAELAGMEE